ncbi:MAG: amino acid ABC transporter substrate-binding protein [Proteobacteria bacterium]|nr:amino acid ABC transporter substrate-binding protein [Pseudomonadota bacterium]
MKFKILIIILVSIISICSFYGNNKGSASQVLTFAISAEYPPFEYRVHGELHGFDIDLARLIAKELGKEAHFADMQFSAILPAVQNGQVNAGISTITVTQYRKQHFDFSHTYYFDSITAVFKKNQPILSMADLNGKKIACQLGTNMEVWLKKNGFANQLITMDNNNQAIEALKAAHVDVVLMDGPQGVIFSKKNSNLDHKTIAQSEDGYGIVMQKHSPLLAEINMAIQNLKKKGEIAKLQEKWLKGDLE